MATERLNYGGAPSFAASTQTPHALVLHRLDKGHQIRTRIARAEEIHAGIERELAAAQRVHRDADEARTAAKARRDKVAADAAKETAEALGRMVDKPDPLAGVLIQEADEHVERTTRVREACAESVRLLIEQLHTTRAVLHGAAELLAAAYRPGEPAPSSPGIVGRLLGASKTEVLKLAPPLNLQRPSGGWHHIRAKGLDNLADLRAQVKLPAWPPLDSALRSAEAALDELAASASPDYRSGRIVFPGMRRSDVGVGGAYGDVPALVDPAAIAARYHPDQVLADVTAAITARYDAADPSKIVILGPDEARLRKRDLQQKIAVAERTVAQATWNMLDEGRPPEIGAFVRGIPATAWFGIAT